MLKRFFQAARHLAIAAVFSLTAMSASSAVRSQASCAPLKIEILQELTLERQGFDAKMRIKNSLATDALENVKVTVSFTDADGKPVEATSDPSDTSARFFIRLDGMTNIADVAGWGRVAPASTAEIHWLIVPAPGAGGEHAGGTLYFVGATLEYLLGSRQETVVVEPDTITVKPQPELRLDYFLPYDVYGDDAFTGDDGKPTIERPEPFSFGVRVANVGHGSGSKVAISTGQPRIIDNKGGLIVDFKILGSQVNGEPANDSLKMNFGTIDPQRAKVGRWSMITSLSGKFVGFNARFSHADDLGGALTSLIRETNTHQLVGDVLVNLPDRDAVPDFLALDDGTLRMYESDGQSYEVNDMSALCSFTRGFGLNQGYAEAILTTPRFSGAAYAKVRVDQRLAAIKAVRGDGSVLPAANYWFSRTRNGTGWSHFVNIFDTNPTGSYLLIARENRAPQQPPVMEPIPDKIVYEGTELGFVVSASDPNDDPFELSASPLPLGAKFTDNAQGQGEFFWQPAVGQAGNYVVTFVADDAIAKTTRRLLLIVRSGADTDNDGMADDWEYENFGHLRRNGTGDLDGDGIKDSAEFFANSEPTAPIVPSAPWIATPGIEDMVTSLTPTLTVRNALHDERHEVDYEFEVYKDAQFSQRVAFEAGIPESSETTAWRVNAVLQENQKYWWRVRAMHGSHASGWMYGRFVVNGQAEKPSPCVVLWPSANGTVGTPEIVLAPRPDPDSDPVTFGAELLDDKNQVLDLARGRDPAADGLIRWKPEVLLSTGKTYSVVCTVRDEAGHTNRSAALSFRVDTAGPALQPPTLVSPNNQRHAWETSVALRIAAPEQDADYVIQYDTDPAFSAPRTAPEDRPALEWQVSGLAENKRHYWRAKAVKDGRESPWVFGDFLVNASNEAPSKVRLQNPGHRSWVVTDKPAFSVVPALDPDGDPLHTEFEFYEDEGLTTLFQSKTVDRKTSWTMDRLMGSERFYWWRARAVDVNGAPGPWSEVQKFYVHTVDVEPLEPRVQVALPSRPAQVGSEGTVVEWIDDDPDSPARVSLFYGKDANGTDFNPLVTDVREDWDNESDEFRWPFAGVAKGVYYLMAQISDGQFTSEFRSQAPVPVKVSTFYDFCMGRNATLGTDKTVEVLLRITGKRDCRLAQKDLQFETSLNIANQELTDLRPLEGLIGLTRLDISNNSISDLAPLALARNLRTLVMHNNQVSSLMPLAQLSHLRELIADRNPIGTGPENCPTDGSAPATAEVCRIHARGKTSLSAGLVPLEVSAGSLVQTLLPGEEFAPVKIVQSSAWDGTVTLSKGEDPCNLFTLSDGVVRASIPHNTSPKDCGATILAKSDSNEIVQALLVIARIRVHGQFLRWCRHPNAPTDIRATVAAVLRKAGASATCEQGQDWLTRTRVVDLSNLGLTNLAPLAHLQGPEALILSGNRIEDVSALADARELKRLVLTGNPVVSLAPLAGVKSIEVIEMEKTRLPRSERVCPRIGLSHGVSWFCIEHLGESEP